MTEFDALCRKLEEMDPKTFTEVFNDISIDVIAQLAKITEDGKDGIAAYLQFLLCTM